MYLTLKQKANTIYHTDLKLDEILFYGKLIVHSNLFSEYTYQKVPNYKNYLVTRNDITHHILLSRPQKILRAGARAARKLAMFSRYHNQYDVLFVMFDISL